NELDSWQSEIEEETAVGKVNEVEDGFIYYTSIRELIPEYNAVGWRSRLVRRTWDFSEVWRVEVSNILGGNVIYQIYPLADGNFVAVGIELFPMEEDYTCVYKFTPDGDILWHSCTRVPGYGHESNTYSLVGVTELSSGSIVAAGTHNRPGNPRKNIAWLVKMDADGCITDSLCIPVSTTEPSLSPPNLTVYPNPATDHVVFEMDSHSGVQPVSVSIYDATGRNIHHYRWQPGVDRYEWDASSNPAGIYIYRLHLSNGDVLSGKIMLLR
ncbi:MAG: T9SS C-terminal target domain-containing protein, partial [Saprospirales bacterium]